MRPNKLVIIGIDGATFNCIDPLVREGKLPNLKKFYEEGTVGELLSTYPPISPAAWASFATGKNPAKHGIFDFVTRDKASYENVLVNGSFIKEPRFWELMGDGGLKVGLFNVPMTYPPTPVNGFMLTDENLTPSNKVCFTYPEALSEEINNRFDGYQVRPKVVYNGSNQVEFIQDFYSCFDKREKILAYLLDSFDCDCHVIVIVEADNAQHRFFHLPDELERVYTRIDAIIGDVLERFGPECTYFIISDHGSGPVRKGFYANRWLEKQGFLRFDQSLSFYTKYFLSRLNFHHNARKFMARVHLSWLQSIVKETTKRKITNAFMSFSDIDWLQTKAYSNGMFGSIYVNLVGREPNGIVKPGEEYEQIINDLIRAFSSLRDPDYGTPLVTRILRRDELGATDLTGNCPDLIVETKDYDILFTLKFGFEEKGVFGPLDNTNTGSHKMQGVLMAKGKNILRGQKIENARIIDLAPTFLYLMGAPVLADMDGVILQGLIEKDLLEKMPVKYTERQKMTGFSPEKDFTAEELETLKRNLQGLGYLS
ncbi:MAG: alkaline phosphatase family protein [Candidatus Schekmanbacteria bacterium]|nr:alkaline phosphatase family protein [Candidatus Schekmanbacteria bacterium]